MVQEVRRQTAASIGDLDTHKQALSTGHPGGSSYMVTAESSGGGGGGAGNGSSTRSRSNSRVASSAAAGAGAASASSSTSTGIPFQRTSTRESHQSTGSGEILSSGSNTTTGNTTLTGIISNTKALFKRHQKRGSISSPVADQPGPSSSSTLLVASDSGSRRSPAPTSIELPPPPAIGTLDPSFSPGSASFISNDTRSSSGDVTGCSSSSSVPQASTCATSTASPSDLSRETSHEIEQQQGSGDSIVGKVSKEGKINIALPSTTSSSSSTSITTAAPAALAPVSSQDYAMNTLPPGAAPMPLTTEARLKALPRLESYSVTHPQLDDALDRTSSRDNDGISPDAADEDRDTTTSLSGTETEHEESEIEEEEEEEEEDEHEHDEEDVRGGVNAMRSALSRPALPTLSSTRGFSRTANTPGVSPTATTSSNPFSFSGWTTFASTTPTPGPLRTARPQAGDNIANGSYFDPRPTSSSSRASTIFQTPSQTPRIEGMPGGSNSGVGSAGRNNSIRQHYSAVSIPTPSSSISPPASRQRVESRPGSASSPLTNRRQSSSVPPFIRNADGQPIPASAIPPIPAAGFATFSSAQSGNISKNVAAPSSAMSASAAAERPAFYARQSKSLVDLSRSFDKQTSVASVNGTADSPDAEVGPADVASANTNSNLGGGDSALACSPPPAIDATIADAHPERIAAVTGLTATDTSHAADNRARAQTVALPKTGTAAAGGAATRTESPARPVQRRQSMPEMRFDPPSYQVDDDFNIQYKDGRLPSAREDEGREALPSYSCEVHIEGYVPRKMEFVKPGVQSKDRRWKRQYVILHGTSVKVYKSDPRQKAVPGEEPPPTPGIYSEKHRPSFSSTSSRQSAGSSSNKQYNAAAASGSARVRAPTQSSISSVSSRESEKSMLYNQAVQEALSKKKYDPDMPVHVHPQEEDEHGLASLQHAPSTLLARASENRCIRHYTLQDAESGLAADYLKRRHVVRIRAEGEQFLIQCKDDRAVIDWIEALQAATNTALDLDVRPLPKFITLPRRRRRRRVDPNAATTTAGAAATSGTTTTGSSTTTTNAGAAASAATGSSTPPNQNSAVGQVSARSDAMNAMLAEDQDNYVSARNTGLA